MKKAKNAPPWTRRKLHRYRVKQRQQWDEERAEERNFQRWLEASTRRIDKMTEGCTWTGRT